MKRFALLTLILSVLQLLLWASWGRTRLVGQALFADLRADPAESTSPIPTWIMCEEMAGSISPETFSVAKAEVNERGAALFAVGQSDPEPLWGALESCAQSPRSCYYFCYEEDWNLPLAARITVHFGLSSHHTEYWCFLFGKWFRVWRSPDIEALLSG